MTTQDCSNCNKTLKINEKAILCDLCNHWLHLKCSNLTFSQYISLSTSYAPYYCIRCIEKNFPFTGINNVEYDTLFHANASGNLHSSEPTKYVRQESNQQLLYENCASSEYINIQSIKSKFSHGNDFCILHVNSRSLNKNFDALEELILQFQKLPDIIAISETKLKQDFLSTLPGYTFLQNNSKSNAGGVGLFIKNSINYNIFNQIQLHSVDCENLWVELEMGHNERQVVGVIYRHPNTDIFRFQENLENLLCELNNKKLNYYICGDINIDL